MKKFIHLPVLLALALAAPAEVLADQDKHFEHLFKTRVSVDAEGRVTDVEFLQDVPAGLKQMVIDVAGDIEFEPATRDGEAVPSRTPLQLGVAFTPVGEDYRADVTSIHGGAPVSVSMTSPRFPSSVLRSRNNVVATVLVQPRSDGTADAEATEVERIEFYRGEDRLENISSRQVRELREALLQAAAEWTYLLEEVEGKVVTTQIRVPVTLCIAKRGTRESTRDICSQWREKVLEDYGRPEPVEPGIRLAQPRLKGQAAPAA